MNKYFSAAFCCGLLLSTGKSYSAGTELLDQLNREKIIGSDSVNPFIAPEVTPSRTHTSSPMKAPVKPKAKPVRTSDISSRQAASNDALRLAMAQDKVNSLTKELQVANEKITVLNQQLASVQTQKAALEKTAAAEKSQAGLNDQAQAMKKQLAETSAQNVALESLFATLKISDSDIKEKNAQLTAQLKNSAARSEELSKQLADLQGQKKSLEDQLAALKINGTGDKQQSAQMAEQLNKANAQSAALLKELAELKLQKKDSEQQLAALQSSSAADKKQSADLSAQLSKSTARSDELSKQLSELQGQKKTLEDQLTTLKSNSTGDKQKSVELTEQLNKTTAQASAVSQQLAEMKQASGALDKQLAELKKQKQDAEAALKNEQTRRDIIVTQLEDAKILIAAQQAQLAVQKTDAAKLPAGKPGEADAAVAVLKKQLEDAKAENATLTQKSQQQDASVQELTLANQKIKADLAALQAKPGQSTAGPSVKGVKIDATTPKDTRTSYAVGTWYGGNITREKEKMTQVGKTLDLPAFMQGFSDSVHKQVQITPDKLSSELIGLDKLHKQKFVATQSENDKQSSMIMAKAAKERGAIKMPDGAIYRIITRGEEPLIITKNEIITEVDEVLGTGKVMSSKEVRASRVKDLPPLFQTVVKKLGLGGEAKLHIPAKQAYGEAGVPGFVPPGTVSIISIKIIGIK